jgi:hypothetical protein
MKKLSVVSYLFIYILLISNLLSCKNEEKSKQLTDASISKKDDVRNTDKTLLSESSLSVDNLSKEEKNTPEIITGIYQDADSLYHLRYIFEKGKTYSFNSREINKQTITFRDKTQSISQESIDPMSFTVLDIKNDIYTLQVNMGGKKVITRADGKEVIFDTNGKKPGDPDQAKMWKIYRAISNVTFTLDMDIYGNASNIKGMDAIYEKAKLTLQSELKGKDLDDFINAFKLGLNPNTFKDQFERSIMKFPAKGLKIGEKWNTQPEMKDRGYNQLIKVGENITEIHLQGTLPSKKDSKVIEGVTYKLSVNGNQSGKVFIDNKSGWISKANFSMNITETKSASKGNDSEKVVQKTVNSTYIN